MRFNGILGLVVAAGLMLSPTVVAAGDVDDTLQQMQERLNQLEERLDATTDELAAANDRVEQQEKLIQQSGIADARGASSGLASFLDTLEVGGWVAGSYFYNFSDPDGDALAGANDPSARGVGYSAYPFHPDANSFQVDQLWFELERPVSTENRAGFRADILWGKTGDILNNGTSDGVSGSDEGLHLYQAYAQYLAPIDIGEGVNFKFGKFATTIGAEVTPTVYNFNVTRGNVFNLLQPITHTGVMAEFETGNFAGAVGYVNDTSNIDVDSNNAKSILWHLGYGDDVLYASFNGLWGAYDGGNEDDKETIYDLIVSWDPNDSFSSYINGTWREQEIVGSSGTVEGWGVSAAGRYAFNDRLGLALRGEYVEDKNSAFAGGIGNNAEIWSATTTLDYALTEKLLVRAEARFDRVHQTSVSHDRVFDGDSGPDESDDQVVGAVEVIYNF